MSKSTGSDQRFTLSSDSVFARRGEGADEVSAHYLNFVIGMTLCSGFLVNWQMVQSIPPESILMFGFWPFIIACFVCCFAGIYLFNLYANPWISFIGYNMVVVPFGGIVNLVIEPYDPGLVIRAV